MILKNSHINNHPSSVAYPSLTRHFNRRSSDRSRAVPVRPPTHSIHHFDWL